MIITIVELTYPQSPQCGGITFRIKFNRCRLSSIQLDLLFTQSPNSIFRFIFTYQRSAAGRRITRYQTLHCLNSHIILVSYLMSNNLTTSPVCQSQHIAADRCKLLRILIQLIGDRQTGCRSSCQCNVHRFTVLTFAITKVIVPSDELYILGRYLNIDIRCSLSPLVTTLCRSCHTCRSGTNTY